MAEPGKPWPGKGSVPWFHLPSCPFQKCPLSTQQDTDTGGNGSEKVILGTNDQGDTRIHSCFTVQKLCIMRRFQRRKTRTLSSVLERTPNAGGG